MSHLPQFHCLAAHCRAYNHLTQGSLLFGMIRWRCTSDVSLTYANFSGKVCCFESYIVKTACSCRTVLTCAIWQLMQTTDVGGMAIYCWMQQTTWQRLPARRKYFCISGVQAHTWCYYSDTGWQFQLLILKLQLAVALHSHSDATLPLQSNAKHSRRHLGVICCLVHA